MRFEVVNVTPKMAEYWLSLNTENRKVRPGYVKALAEAMKRGEFVASHQPIAVNGERLLDGQHRLLAVIASGAKAVPLTVAFEVDSSTFDVIDTGVRRSVADIYHADPMVMNPIAYLLRHCVNKKLTAKQIQPYYYKLAPLMNEIVRSVPRNAKRLSASPVRAGIAVSIMDGQDKRDVLGMYKEMSDFSLENLPRVGQVFVKQLLTGKTQHDNSFDMLIRTYIAFQKENADLSRIRVTEESNNIEKIRKIVRDYIGLYVE